MQSEPVGFVRSLCIMFIIIHPNGIIRFVLIDSLSHTSPRSILYSPLHVLCMACHYNPIQVNTNVIISDRVLAMNEIDKEKKIEFESEKMFKSKE